ncbi:MAG: DUF2334 domain-containing protein, partial [Armatimonadetes bacterium]|nr:DUF2334 domain-containing protein [Armatimonadota bacterium]
MRAIFTSDDVGTGDRRSLDAFHTVTAWLEARGLRGTFFWIPKPGSPADEDPVWVPVLRAAAVRGHDFQLHGLTHATCLEFGLPQASTRRSNPAPFDEYERHRDHWARRHSVPALTARLTEGIERFERVFGRRPAVFRAPCFGMGATAYEALHAVGIHHSSSRGLNPTATAYTITKDATLRRWAPDYPCRPYLEPPGVTEYACFEDLTIAGVPAEECDDRLDLYRSELGHFLEEAGEDGVLVFGTHFRSMYGSWDVVRPLF